MARRCLVFPYIMMRTLFHDRRAFLFFLALICLIGLLVSRLGRTPESPKSDVLTAADVSVQQDFKRWLMNNEPVADVDYNGNTIIVVWLDSHVAQDSLSAQSLANEVADEYAQRNGKGVAMCWVRPYKKSYSIATGYHPRWAKHLVEK